MDTQALEQRPRPPLEVRETRRLAKGVHVESLVMKYEALSALQREQVLEIEVLAEQKSWIGDIHGVLHTLTARPASDIQGYALLIDDVPRGFFLLKRRSLLPGWAPPQSATLHGFLIDRRYQGLGLGRVCVQALPHCVANLWPEVEQLMLAVHPANVAALGLYHALGWTLCDVDACPLANPERCMMFSLR